MSLIDELLKPGFTAKEADRYLMNLFRTAAPGGVSAELNQTDARGMSPLLFAVNKGDLELLEVLLSFDVITTIKVAGKTIEKIAEEKCSDASLSAEAIMNRKKVHALLQSRGEWQATSARDGIQFSRSIRAIQEAVQNIQGADAKNGVLIFGLTGEGKSTIVNWLIAMVNYRRVKKAGLTRVEKSDASQSELASVGASVRSETLYPQVLPSPEGSHVYVDMPGFEDTRGTAEELCAAASICMLTKQLSAIQAICLVVSWGSLADTRILNYRKLADSIGKMIAQNPVTAENIILLVTKTEPTLIDEEIVYLTPEDVIERLKTIAQDEKFSEFKVTDTEELSPDDRRKLFLKMTTEAILRNGPTAIVLADVTRPVVRAEVHAAVGRLQRKLKKPQQFNFNGYSRFMVGFQLVLENIIVKHNELKRADSSQTEKLKSTEASIAMQDAEESKLDQEIRSYQEQKTEPFTATQFDQRIADQKSMLNSLRERYSKSQESLHSAEREVDKQAAILKSTDSKEEEKLIDVVNRGWVCEKTEAIHYKAMKKTGRLVPLLHGGMAEMVEEEDVTLPGKEKTVSEAITYPSPVPIRRFVDTSTGGRFECSGFMPGAKTLSGMFTSAEGAHGGVSLRVELYGNSHDFPEFQDLKNNATSQLSDAEDKLTRLKKDMVTMADIEAAADTLRGLELEKISAVGNRERTELVCDMQIKLLNEQKSKITEKKKELHRQMMLERLAAEQIGLQLEVNQKLFSTIRSVITALDFRSEVIDQFMSLFSGAAASVPSRGTPASLPRGSERPAAGGAGTHSFYHPPGAPSRKSTESAAVAFGSD